MNKVKLSCGCEFEKKDDDFIVDYNLDSINLECHKVWDLISSGRTIGLFQIDSGLGQQMSARLKPENIHQLAALIAIMRPSCTQGTLEDGKSIADHFIDRKNGIEESKVAYTALADVLKDTYNLLIYQEQTIRIGQEVAGMSLIDADYYLRSGIGKKKADVIAKAEKVFLDGAKKLGKVNEKEAIQIFEWIKSSARYQFNAAHSYGYAFTTYLTAVAKAHFPDKFFLSWLKHAKDKIKPLQEIKNLVQDAKQFNIDVCPPDVRLKNPDFILKDGHIVFGLGNIKGIGEKALESFVALIQASEDKGDVSTLSWSKLLCGTLLNANKTTIKHLLAVNAFPWIKMTREQMLFEHDTSLKLTKKEVEWINKNLDLQQFSSLTGILTDILTCPIGRGNAISNKNRQNIIKGLEFSLVNSPYSNKDSIRRICILEESYLGVTLTAHKSDEVSKELSDTTIKEASDGKTGILKLLAQITFIKQILTKKNKDEMAFITLEDNTGQINSVCFPTVYKKIKNEIFESGTFLICAERTEKDSLQILGLKQV